MSTGKNNNQFDADTVRQLQQLKQLLIDQTGGENNDHQTMINNNLMGINKDSVKFNRQLLDYDYDEDEDETDKAHNIDSSSANQNVVEVK